MQLSKQNTLWCIGDSFCASGGNWIKTLTTSLNLNLGSLGIGGSGLQSAYNQFMIIKDRIKENDRVLFCYSTHNRNLFNNKHHAVHILTGIVPMDYHTKEEVNAYKEYITHLHTDKEELVRGTAMLYYIIENLLKKLPTDKIVCLPSVDDSYNQMDYPNHFWLEYPNLFKFAIDYVVAKYPDKTLDECSKIIPNGNNHWIGDDDEEYGIQFFKKYKPLLSKLDFDVYPTKAINRSLL